MDKELVIVVPNEAAAYNVVKALKGLDDDGAIELYASTVLMKTPQGAITVKDREHVRGTGAALLAVSTGALIGLLAGPVGAAVGAAIGGAAVIGEELAYSGFAGDFVHNVASHLRPNDFAVCASVWEDWTMPIDVATAPFGAAVFRQATDDVVVAQIRAEWQNLKDEQAHLEAEISRAVDDERAKLEGKRDEIRAKLSAQRARLHTGAKQLDERWHAKIDSIKAKAKDAKTEARARHHQHLEKLSRFAQEQKVSFSQLFA